MTFSAELSKFPDLFPLIAADVIVHIKTKGVSASSVNEIMNSNPSRYKPLTDLSKQDKSIIMMVGKFMEAQVAHLLAYEKLPTYSGSDMQKAISVLKASSPDLKRSILLLSAVYKFVTDLPFKSK